MCNNKNLFLCNSSNNIYFWLKAGIHYMTLVLFFAPKCSLEESMLVKKYLDCEQSELKQLYDRRRLRFMFSFLHEFEFGTTVFLCMMPNTFENYSERLCGTLALRQHKSQNRLKVVMVHTGNGFMSVTGKDTALAWLMPTKTAMQRITLAHSRLNLCGSPRWWSKQGYKRPTTAEERKKHKCFKQQ